MKKKLRKCPICNHAKTKVIYKQRFSNLFTHKISSCNKCGFIFVKNTPDQEYYSNYYKKSRKYEFDRGGEFHNKYIKLIDDFIKNKISLKNPRILDIGCSAGHLLAALKKRG